MKTDVIVIGAGPAGAALAAILAQNGFSVSILEKTVFPRFSIGESLLPQCMTFLEKANLLSAVPEAYFQIKKGALFARGKRTSKIDFSQKFSDGPSQTWQVERSLFDDFLVKKAVSLGASILFDCAVQDILFKKDSVDVKILQSGEQKSIRASFIVDASGGAMVLPRLMNTVNKPKLSKVALFQHFSGEERSLEESENILISIHPENNKIWYWGIPFKNNKISVGVVSDEKTLSSFKGSDCDIFHTLCSQEPNLKRRLKNAYGSNSVQRIEGYEAAVEKIHGDRFLIIGNAAGFIDPIFSSGITIALKSAVTAAPEIINFLKNKQADWQTYDAEMATGTKTFQAYVDAWYDSSLQEIILTQNKEPDIQSKINSILAGYVWDQKNSFVREPKRKLKQVYKLLERIKS